MAGDASSNALVIKGSTEAQNEIKRIVRPAGYEQDAERQVKIFQLQNIVPGPILENMLGGGHGR